jgi:hypothetical protein
VTLAWDTGAFASVLRKGLIDSAHPTRTADTFKTKRFVLGGKNFGPQEFQIWDLSLPEFDGFVGNDFFATHVVCVDFPAPRLRVQ